MVFFCRNPSCKAPPFKEKSGLSQHRRFCQYEVTPVVIDAAEKYRAKKWRRLDARHSTPEPPHDDPRDIYMELDLPPPPPEPPAEEPPTTPAQAETEPEQLGRGQRKRRPTWKVQQSLPDNDPPPIQETSHNPSTCPETSQTSNQEQPAFIWKAIRTLKNSFGVWREYPDTPSHIPSTHTMSPTSSPPQETEVAELPPSLELPNVSFSSSTAAGILQWMWTGSATKSIQEVNRLISFLKSNAFKKEDLDGFDLSKETDRLDAWLGNPNPPTDNQCNRSNPLAEHSPASPIQGASHAHTSQSTLENASSSPPVNSSAIPTTSNAPPCGKCSRAPWRTTKVDLEIPDGKSHPPSLQAPVFTVPGLQLRSLVDIIKSVFSSPESKSFHYTPFKSFWTPPFTEPSEQQPDERIYDKLFSSDAMIEEHQRIHQLPAEKFQGQDLERVVAAMMFWSDSTHLTDFGNASLWPVYLFFGNQSKYDRASPQSGACHHAAYMPKLPDSFNDWFHALTNKVPDIDMLAHCRRELIHKIWQLLLDEEFMHAYKHGIVILCPDGKYRRFFPRIFTYSADYPEKVQLATIRNMGNCPCPGCLIEKKEIFDIGTVNDRKRRKQRERVDSWEFSSIKTARGWIYEGGDGVKSAAVERALKAKSLVPTLNAFEMLALFAFSIRKALVVDLMHEIELGVWKALFTHLIRILYASGPKVVQELNRRYRLVPTFGTSNIRRFSDDVASMKKMAARNFENLLQCAIPCFEELVPDSHNKEVLTLLYTMAEWHALAKLRLHTSTTLQLLDEATTDLGRLLRRFRTHTCGHFLTRELPSEAAKKVRQAASKKAKGGDSMATSQVKSSPSDDKIFSLSTYKIHALGHYVSTIERFGTTDSYSTQTGELEHRRVKKYYKRTNKRAAAKQMTQLERREHFLSKLPPLPTEPPKPNSKQPMAIPRESSTHCVISNGRNHPIDITKFLAEHCGDPAIKDFLPRLKMHLLWQIANPGLAPIGHEEYAPAEYSRIQIVGNRIFETKTVRINYTTYDLRRAQDFLGVGHEANIMLQSREEDNDQPYEYARILRVFHVLVTHQVPGGSAVTQDFNVIFVRRYRFDPSHRAGFKRKRLPRLQLLPLSDPEAFDFVDPDNIIRAAHLIPAFCLSTYDADPTKSLAWVPDEPYRWQYLYVNIFADRDMYMRFRGGGVGHYHVPLPLDEDLEDSGVFPLETTDELTCIIAQETLVESEPEDNDNDSSDDENELLDEGVIQNNADDI